MRNVKALSPGKILQHSDLSTYSMRNSHTNTKLSFYFSVSVQPILLPSVLWGSLHGSMTSSLTPLIYRKMFPNLWNYILNTEHSWTSLLTSHFLLDNSETFQIEVFQIWFSLFRFLHLSQGAQPRALDTTRKHSTYTSIPSAPPCRHLNFPMSNFRWKEGGSMPSEKRGNKKAMPHIPNCRYLIRNRQ